MAALQDIRLSSRPQGKDWTASSAGRLLRPLQASLAALHRNTTQAHYFSLPLDGKPSTQKGDTRTTDTLNNVFFAKRKAQVTYRAKKAPPRDRVNITTSSDDQTPTKPYVGITLPTPFRRNSAADLGPAFEFRSESRASRPFSEASDPRLPQSGTRTAANGMSFSLDRMVTEKFQRLLLATKAPSCKPKHSSLRQSGARSLLSLSLGMVPEYVEAEEKLRRSEDPDDRSDVSLEMLQWLEDIGKLTYQPDLCLREAVRAQGIWLLRKAIAENLIAADLVKQTVSWCCASDECLAARAIADAFMRCDGTRNSYASIRQVAGKGFVESDALNMIADLCRSSNSLSPFALINTALSSKSLSLFVLSSEKGLMYTSQAVRAVASKSRHWRDALQLLQTIICQACGLGPLDGDKLPNRLKRTERPDPPSLKYTMPGGQSIFENQDVEFIAGVHGAVADLCSTIVSMAYIGKTSSIRFKDGEEAACHLLVRVIKDAALGSMRLFATEGVIQSASDIGIAPLVCVVLLTDLLIALMKLEPVSSEVTAMRPQQQHLGYIVRFCEGQGGSKSSVITQSLALFLRDLALNCEGSRKGAGFDLLRELTDALLYPSSDASIQRSITKVSLEAALSFAHRTHDAAHVTFANDLEQRIQEATKRSTIGTPARSTQTKRLSIRWDGGLCEWVSATPINNRRNGLSQVEQNPGNKEDDDVKHEPSQTPGDFTDKENDVMTITQSLAPHVPVTQSRSKDLASMPAHPLKAKRRFIDFLAYDEDFHDELALDAPRALQDITNTERPWKQRRTI